ncbi:MAG: PH domain-containing protein [Candidatus Pacearchaeota archaeon]
MKEEVKVMRVRHSRKKYFFIYSMVVVLFVMLFFASISGKEISSFAFKSVIAFSIIAVLTIEIHRFSSFFEINPSSIVFSNGIINKNTRKFNLGSISDADSDQHIFGRIFNYGDVNVHLFEHINSIKGIDNPDRFLNFLIYTMREHKK